VENPDFPTLRRGTTDSATEPGPSISTRERNPAPATDRGEFRTPPPRSPPARAPGTPGGPGSTLAR
jgi:hypothetical protein